MPGTQNGSLVPSELSCDKKNQHQSSGSSTSTSIWAITMLSRKLAFLMWKTVCNRELAPSSMPIPALLFESFHSPPTNIRAIISFFPLYGMNSLSHPSLSSTTLGEFVFKKTADKPSSPIPSKYSVTKLIAPCRLFLELLIHRFPLL